MCVYTFNVLIRISVVTRRSYKVCTDVSRFTAGSACLPYKPASGWETNLDSCTEVRKIVRVDLDAGGQPPSEPHILQLPLTVVHRVHARCGRKCGERTIVGQSRD